MIRKALPAVALALVFGLGCAGPSKLAQVSQDKLAKGDMWKAWALATKALDKAPANADARRAAHAASYAIADDWRRKITALAATDSMAAAEQVLEFATFRTQAARYVTVPVDPDWTAQEQTLRQGAARFHYQQGTADLETRRPKRAYLHFVDAERFVPHYRNASQLEDKALSRAITSVAFVPLRSAQGRNGVGADVAEAWRGECVERLTTETHFTRILPVEDVERALSVSDLARLNRDDAVMLGKRAKADRVVWGSIGPTQSKTGFSVFADVVWHRVTVRDGSGSTTTSWVAVPIEVVARTRTVTVPVDYEVISTRGGVTLARRNDTRTLNARVVWTSYVPTGSCGDYALVSETMRTADPDRCRRIESRWAAVVGEGTTLVQVLEARRSANNASADRRQVLARLATGAAFVMLEELPSADELSMAALSSDWQPLYKDLLHLDPMDDVDLGLTAVETDRR